MRNTAYKTTSEIRYHLLRFPAYRFLSAKVEEALTQFRLYDTALSLGTRTIEKDELQAPRVYKLLSAREDIIIQLQKELAEHNLACTEGPTLASLGPKEL